MSDLMVAGAERSALATPPAAADWGAGDDGRVNYVRGANLAGFKRIADAMLAYGIV
jgi:hypothetical protein